VQNAIFALGHKTHVGSWGVNALFTYGYEKSNHKEILNMKYPSKGIKLVFMVVYLMKLDAHSISNN
jgi:hypothetical protein